MVVSNIAPAGPPFTVFYQAPDADTEGDIAMAVPVAEAIDTDPADLLTEIVFPISSAETVVS